MCLSHCEIFTKIRVWVTDLLGVASPPLPPQNDRWSIQTSFPIIPQSKTTPPTKGMIQICVFTSKLLRGLAPKLPCTFSSPADGRIRCTCVACLFFSGDRSFASSYDYSVLAWRVRWLCFFPSCLTLWLLRPTHGARLFFGSTVYTCLISGWCCLRHTLCILYSGFVVLMGRCHFVSFLLASLFDAKWARSSVVWPSTTQENTNYTIFSAITRLWLASWWCCCCIPLAPLLTSSLLLWSLISWVPLHCIFVSWCWRCQPNTHHMAAIHPPRTKTSSSMPAFFVACAALGQSPAVWTKPSPQRPGVWDGEGWTNELVCSGGLRSMGAVPTLWYGAGGG